MKIRKFNESIEDKKLQKVKATQDDSGHWFVIPIDKYEEYNIDSENEDMVDSGEFDDKWGKYRTGGDLNLIQLWAEV